MPKIQHMSLAQFYDADAATTEIGVDEAGRGPMFGRVYAGAVALPKDDAQFDHAMMRDSKKFTSKAQIEKAEQYIKDNAIAWGVAYETERVIESSNILQATQMAMHRAITIARQSAADDNLLLLIDGNYFKPYLCLKTGSTSSCAVPFKTIKQGDNTYSSIAAASILAKVARDRYIDELCDQHPDLDAFYGIRKNKGYGTKQHMDGIGKHGISEWHRKTFGACKNY